VLVYEPLTRGDVDTEMLETTVVLPSIMSGANVFFSEIIQPKSSKHDTAKRADRIFKRPPSGITSSVGISGQREFLRSISNVSADTVFYYITGHNAK
jgi:hypothetical protein